MIGELLDLGAVCIRYAAIAGLHAAAGWFVGWKLFRDYGLCTRLLAFVGGAALLAAALDASGGPLFTAFLAFGTIAVLDHLKKKDKNPT